MDGKQIKEITPKGLMYIDDTGVEQFINFAKCYEIYVQEMLSPEHWEQHKQLNNKSDEDWDAYVEWIQRHKLVADRNILTPPWADGPYIEFYTKPPIRFKFDTTEEFRKIYGLIHEAGWTTSDLS
jgi:hypothetical protein